MTPAERRELRLAAHRQLRAPVPACVVNGSPEVAKSHRADAVIVADFAVHGNGAGRARLALSRMRGLSGVTPAGQAGAARAGGAPLALTPPNNTGVTRG